MNGSICVCMDLESITRIILLIRTNENCELGSFRASDIIIRGYTELKNSSFDP